MMMMIMMMMMMMMTMMMKIEFFVGNRRTRNGDSSDPNLRLHPSLAASIHLHLICILFAYHVRVLCAVGQAISSSLYSSIDFFFYWDRGSLFVLFFLFCFFFIFFWLWKGNVCSKMFRLPVSRRNSKPFHRCQIYWKHQKRQISIKKNTVRLSPNAMERYEIFSFFLGVQRGGPQGGHRGCPEMSSCLSFTNAMERYELLFFFMGVQRGGATGGPQGVHRDVTSRTVSGRTVVRSTAHAGPFAYTNSY